MSRREDKRTETPVNDALPGPVPGGASALWGQSTAAVFYPGLKLGFIFKRIISLVREHAGDAAAGACDGRESGELTLLRNENVRASVYNR